MTSSSRVNLDLAGLQRAFLQHVVSHDDAIASQVNGSETVSAATRLAVYTDAYRLRLVDALAYNYPRLQQLLGPAAFDPLARDYLSVHPSTNTSVRWFGDRLAQHLEAQADNREKPWLAELAGWEWAIAAAFDSPDADALTEQAFGSIEPAQWPTLRFRFHPSVQQLQLRTNAPALFKALSDEAPPPAPVCLDAPQQWLIWRHNLTPRYRSLSADEARAMQTVAAQGTFEQMCETLCEYHEAAEVPVRAVILLKGWIHEQMVVEVISGTE